MGCELGKLALAQRGGSNGGGDSDVGMQEGGGGQRGGAPAKPDPRLPLTAKQKYSMLASWKGISRAMEPTGVYMFIKLFEEHRELLELFTKFRELRTRDEQASSMELAEHANKVMTTLDEGIKELDNLDTFFEYLTNVGASHKKIPGFKPEYFWRIEKPFLEAVKMTLGDRYTENVENIYQITIKLIIETLEKGYNT
ncbi:neuroglobin [Nilaparvata lugens]|uniref:neuroglobin n=1 Tax=Nilaparvata lugens TaxID=108931 RepID=UPI000B98CBF5|nr:neuroglobin [Nilaparvata lugens]XP_039293812.1 neuroglobin [Nilaparvata lugens]